LYMIREKTKIYIQVKHVVTYTCNFFLSDGERIVIFYKGKKFNFFFQT